jgi:hypothetical protein
MPENKIVKVELNLLDNGHWTVAVTKTFAPDHGGGQQTFTENAGTQIHRALDIAKEMVTFHPAYRTDLAAVGMMQATGARSVTVTETHVPLDGPPVQLSKVAATRPAHREIPPRTYIIKLKPNVVTTYMLRPEMLALVQNLRSLDKGKQFYAFDVRYVNEAAVQELIKIDARIESASIDGDICLCGAPRPCDCPASPNGGSDGN